MATGNDKRHAPAVSVVIVCMNQPKRLFACLDSLYSQNKQVPFEVWVVAYRFTPENLDLLRKRHPSVCIVESNEVRGFAENNNLALRQARGEFCLCINDDTRMEMPVLDLLAESFARHPEAAVFIPKILNPDGSVQFCGGFEMTIGYWVLREFRLLKTLRIRSPFVNQPGVFRTRNILGAAFMIRTSVFRELGYFDERYFFTPEDTALSTLANERGYACYVNADVEIIHDFHATLSSHFLPVMAAMQRGQSIFFSKGSGLRWFGFSLLLVVRALFRLAYWGFRRGESARLHRRAWRMLFSTAFSRSTPKELFMRYSENGI